VGEDIGLFFCDTVYNKAVIKLYELRTMYDACMYGVIV